MNKSTLSVNYAEHVVRNAIILIKKTIVSVGNRAERLVVFAKYHFAEKNIKQKFGQWLFSEQHKNYTALAHNMKGYDGFFVLEYLVENSIVPQVIYSGSKLMYIHVANQLNIRVLDSYNFLPTKLSNLPKAFGLSELKKVISHIFFKTQLKIKVTWANIPILLITDVTL